ncbi:MAG TPA: hypothetical protein VI685_21130, partial [Candidatus Angelobacter sp.]
VIVRTISFEEHISRVRSGDRHRADGSPQNSRRAATRHPRTHRASPRGLVSTSPTPLGKKGTPAKFQFSATGQLWQRGESGGNGRVVSLR